METGTPVVSVIVATYNWSSVLRYALLSIQAQTFRDFEVLVVGDGCTDDSGEVVAGLNDSRFLWENLPVNHGHQSAPNNRGLEKARGKWIAYLGHDDLWMPNHLQSHLDVLEATNADVGFSLVVGLGAPDCGGRRLFGGFPNGIFPLGGHTPPSAIVHRRELVEKFGGWSDHRTIATMPESDLYARFYAGGAVFRSVPEVTAFKFPSSWRPRCYVERPSHEQEDCFRRMHSEPDFLKRELTQLAIAMELALPHTRVPLPSFEDEITPGALVEGFRRTRGLTEDASQSGPARYMPGPAIWNTANQLADEIIAKREGARATFFEIFYAKEGKYGGGRNSRVVLPIGKWRRVSVKLAYETDGAPLRLDPSGRSGLIEIAGIHLRHDERVLWRLRGKDLQSLQPRGDVAVLEIGRTLRLQSLGNDPRLILPTGLSTPVGATLVCWLKVTT